MMIKHFETQPYQKYNSTSHVILSVVLHICLSFLEEQFRLGAEKIATPKFFFIYILRRIVRYFFEVMRIDSIQQHIVIAEVSNLSYFMCG
jgi:hypothetical protein